MNDCEHVFSIHHFQGFSRVLTIDSQNQSEEIAVSAFLCQIVKTNKKVTSGGHVTTLLLLDRPQ
jgi:hypothetical protein